MDQMIFSWRSQTTRMLLDLSQPRNSSVFLCQKTWLWLLLIQTKTRFGRQWIQHASWTVWRSSAHLGVPALRDVTIEQFNAKVSELDEMVAKRARHVITEKWPYGWSGLLYVPGRYEACMGELMAESHASMRDDFERQPVQVDTWLMLVKDVIGTGGGVRRPARFWWLYRGTVPPA